MKGTRVWHGHTRGFLAPPIAASADFVVDTETNFIVGAPYEQEDLPADAKNQVLAATLAYCEARAAARDAAGFFYQQHTNGHEIVGFYRDAADMASGARTPLPISHVRFAPCHSASSQS
eukprot:4404863-Prymnesium_polylepis.1